MNKKMLIGPALLGAFLLLGADSCNPASSSSVEQQQVDSQLNTYNNHNQPIHTYQYSAERAELQQILDMRIKGELNTWSVWVSNSGVPLGMCPSKGFPIPYSTELTNPQQVTNGGSGTSAGNVTIGQMDPQGTFPAQNASATWIMCLSPDGSLHPQYAEPLVLAYAHEVAIRDGKIVDVGAATTESTVKAK